RFLLIIFLTILHPPTSTLFPYTTLFRSKDDFVPLNGGNLVIETRDGATTEKCTRRFRRIKDRSLDFLLGCNPPHQALPRQFVVQSTVEIEVMIFQIDRLQPGIAPRKFFLFLQCIQSKLLCRPINAI